MTTTPAGWYPDPDGTGGQRYWDGNAWTEHRTPAPTAPPAAPTPPPEPEPPAAPPPASESPTVVVPPPTPAEESPTVVVQRRQPDEDATVVVPMRTPPAPDDHAGGHRQPEDPPGPSETPLPDFSFVPTPPGPPPGPPPVPPTTPLYDSPSTPNTNGPLVMRYLAACGALLVILIGLAIYGFFIRESPELEISAGGSTFSEESLTDTKTTVDDSESTETETETQSPTDSPTPLPEPGATVDGPLSFTVHGVEIGSTVVSSDAPIEKTAVGEYVVVNLTVTNVSGDPASFIGQFQKLLAGGTVYDIDPEATFYVGGSLAELAPGASADVAVAFDVPPGTPPEAIELHADPISPGVQIPLS